MQMMNDEPMAHVNCVERMKTYWLKKKKKKGEKHNTP